MSRTLVRGVSASLRTSIALLLVLAAVPLGAPVNTSAAEVTSTELVSGVPNAVVYAHPGETVYFPINVSAGGYLISGVTQSFPASARLDTEYLLATWGTSSSAPSRACSFWPRDSLGTVTWTGAPNPYVVQASVFVASNVPHGEYRVPIKAVVTCPVVGPQDLMLNDIYQDSFVVHVEPPVDATPPVTASTLSGVQGTGGWFVSDVQVALSAADAGSGVAATEFSLDQGETWQQYSAPFTVSAEGVSTVYYRSTDIAGNAEDYKYCQTSIDKCDPTVDIASVADGAVCCGAPLEYAAADALPGSGLASVSLLLDGAVVSPGSSVAGEGVHTVTAIAVDTAGRRTAHAHQFTVHQGGPEIVIASPTSGAHNTAQTFDYTVTDEFGITGTSSFPALGYAWSAEGAYNATVDAVDAIGNAASASVAFLIDSTVPTTTADVAGAMGEYGWWQSSAQVRLNASDPLSGGVASGIGATKVRLDGGEWADFAGALTVEGNGQHRVEYYSLDVAGNEELIQSLAVDIDALAPTVTPSVIGAVGAEGYYVGTTQLVLDGADTHSGIARLEYDIDGEGWKTYSGPVLFEDGVHDVKVRAVDIAGNVSDVTALDVRVDTVAPVTTALPSGDSGANGWYTGPVSISFTAEDATPSSGLAYTEYSLDDGASWLRWDGSPITISDPGVVSVQYRSADLAGNLEGASSVTARVDLADPTVSLIGISEGARMPQALVSVSADDPSPGSGVEGISATLDGQPIALGALVVEDGSHVLSVTVLDASGRATTASASFVVDRSAPVISISSPVDGSAVQTEQLVDFIVTDDDPGATWDSNFNDGEVLSLEGAYVLTVDARDTLGNSSQRSSSCVIDRTPPMVSPDVSGMLGANNWWVSNVSVALNVSDPPPSMSVASGVASVRYRVDGGPWTEYAGAFTLSDGTHTVSWQAADRAGNTTTGSTAIDVDTIAPRATSTSPAAGATYLYGQSLTMQYAISESGSGLANQSATFNGAPVVNNQTLVMTQPGDNALNLAAVDVAGNVANVTYHCTVAFNGGAWIMPAAGQTTWKAGQTLKAQLEIYDFHSIPTPTDGAVVSVEVRINGNAPTTGTAIVRRAGGVPYYEYTIRTVKGQLGTMQITASCNDRVTVLSKSLALVN